MFISGIAFACPKCDAEIAIKGAGIKADGNIYLVGHCHDCQCQVILNIESVITVLSDSRKGN